MQNKWGVTKIASTACLRYFGIVGSTYTGLVKQSGPIKIYQLVAWV